MDKGKETMQDSTLRALVDLRDKQIQKARIQFGNRLGAIERQDDNTTDRQQQIVERWLNRFSQLESELDQDIEAAAGEYRIYPYVTEIRGIGPLLAAKLIAMIDIERASTPSALWKYAGYAVDQNGERDRLHKGEKSPYNTRLKTTCYLIGTSMLRCNSPYRRVYDAAKERYQATRPDWNKARIDMASRRKMIKVFLVHLWLVWRELEGLPTRTPYVQEHMGHTHIIQPEEMGWRK
jgi:transposase